MSKDIPIRTIVVGIDGSDGAGDAMRWAIALARPTGAEVVAVHAFDVPYAPVTPGFTMVPDLEAWAKAERQTFEQTWCEPLTESGVTHRTVFRVGHAGTVLTQVVDEVQADLVVTGRRGLNTLVELLAGSVSQHLVHRAHCAVVVVPATVAVEKRPEPAAVRA